MESNKHIQSRDLKNIFDLIDLSALGSHLEAPTGFK
jgi:hypothetical protein